MGIIPRLLLLAMIPALIILDSQARAQDASNYPERVVRIVVPFSAVGGIDVIARIVAQRLSAHIGFGKEMGR